MATVAYCVAAPYLLAIKWKKGKDDKANPIVRPAYDVWSAHGGFSWLDDAIALWLPNWDAGMLDVSYMTTVDLHGAYTREFLRYLLANDIAKLTQPGKALYTGILNDSGGVIDDLIVYFLAEDYFRLVVNSATREKDLS